MKLSALATKMEQVMASEPADRWLLPPGVTLTDEERAELDELFPAVRCPHRAFGNKIVVQQKAAVERRKSGLIIVSESQMHDEMQMTEARVVSIGPEACMVAALGDVERKGWDLKVGQLVRLPALTSNRMKDGAQPKVIWRTITGGEINSIIDDPRDVLGG